MDYLQKIRDIIRLLKKNEFSDEAEAVSLILNTSFTSTELLFKTLYELNELCQENSKIESIIHLRVQELKDFCNSQGIYLKK